MALTTDIYGSCNDGLLTCLALWSNEVTGGRFFTLILLGIIITLFLATIRFGTMRAYAYASMTGIFFSIILALTGLMSWLFASMFIINGAVAIALMISSDR